MDQWSRNQNTDSGLVLRSPLFFLTAIIAEGSSIVIFEDLVAIYQQWGGGLDGVGHHLASFLKKNADGEHVDMEELAANYIRQHREDKAGHPFYIYPVAAIEGSNCNCVLYYVFRQLYHPGRTMVQMSKSAALSFDEFLKIRRENEIKGSWL